MNLEVSTTDFTDASGAIYQMVNLLACSVLALIAMAI